MQGQNSQLPSDHDNGSRIVLDFTKSSSQNSLSLSSSSIQFIGNCAADAESSDAYYAIISGLVCYITGINMLWIFISLLPLIFCLLLHHFNSNSFYYFISILQHTSTKKYNKVKGKKSGFIFLRTLIRCLYNLLLFRLPLSCRWF